MNKRSLMLASCQILPEPNVALFMSRKKMFKALGDKVMSMPELVHGFDAQTFPVSLDDGSRVWIVLYEPKSEDRSKRISLLAHEAVHVAIGHLREIGEYEPGEEELAYTVQSVMEAMLVLLNEVGDGK